MKGRKRSTRPAILASIYFAILSLGLGLIHNEYKDYLKKKYFKEIGLGQYKSGLQAVETNYGEEIKKQALKRNLNSDFLKAICMLECSGRKIVPSRFEPHVYKKLVAVKKTKGAFYERIQHHQIKMMSDGAIRNLSSSWGPFQLMGIRSVNLNCSVSDLRGPLAVEKAIEWIDAEYGYLIKEKRYKDAFHKHNTGKLYPDFGPPKTFNPQYVNLGIRFMDYYRTITTGEVKK